MNKAKRILTLVTYVVDIVATIIIVVFILNFDNTTGIENKTTSENYDHLYMVESTVTDIDNNVVSVTTVNGDIFKFYSNGTWLENDGCILLLDNNNTPKNVTDDIIINELYDMRKSER